MLNGPIARRFLRCFLHRCCHCAVWRRVTRDGGGNRSRAGICVLVNAQQSSARRAFRAEVIPALKFADADVKARSNALERVSATNPIMDQARAWRHCGNN